MGQRTLGGADLTHLRQRYRELVTAELPVAAQRGEGWPVRRDHCFARVVLDNHFGGVWYEHVDGRPAYRSLPAADLRGAIAIAERMLETGPSLAEALNERSCRWRAERRATGRQP